MEEQKEDIGHGHWYFDTFESYPWKGFLRYVLGWVPEKTSPALIWGGALHAGVASWWRTFDPQVVLDQFQAEMDARQGECEDRERWSLDVERGLRLLGIYCEKYVTDPEEYDTVAVEEPAQLKVSGVPFNFRIDAVVRSKRSGTYIIHETKSSSSLTPEKIMGKVRDQDQATAYLYAWNTLHPDKRAEVVVPDVLYNNKSVYDCQRMESGVYRSSAELEQWADGASRFAHEVQNRINIVKDGCPPYKSFKRAFSCDGDGFYRCDYKPICRLPLSFDAPPAGYKIAERRD